MQIIPTRMCNVTAWRHSGLHAHWLMALVPGGWGGIPWELQGLLSLFCLWYQRRSLWAELNGGENSLHWKANMLPLFSIMTLWFQRIKVFVVQISIQIYIAELMSIHTGLVSEIPHYCHRNITEEQINPFFSFILWIFSSWFIISASQAMIGFLGLLRIIIR